MQTFTNIYALSDRLTTSQTQLFLEFGVVLCVVGFLLAEYTLLATLGNWFVGLLYREEPGMSVVSQRRI